MKAMKRIYIPKKVNKCIGINYSTLLTALLSFVVGCIVSTVIFMNYYFLHLSSTLYEQQRQQQPQNPPVSPMMSSDMASSRRMKQQILADDRGSNNNWMSLWKSRYHHDKTKPKQTETQSIEDCESLQLSMNRREMSEIDSSLFESSSLSSSSLTNPTTSMSDMKRTSSTTVDNNNNNNNNDNNINEKEHMLDVNSVLRNLNILVVIASYDFSQIPHLEEVLSSYHDLCIVGSNTTVDVVIHTTVAYPVTYIDMYNSRFNCPTFRIQIVIKPKSLRLHLVDCHRQTFYDNINSYDLFIYTEDDIRVTPTTVATYLFETKFIEKTLQQQALFNDSLGGESVTDDSNSKEQTYPRYKPSDFNVGIVRFEYNYPANVVIDDNTRHATQNVSRVYWEHSGSYERPGGVVPNAVRPLMPQKSIADTTEEDEESTKLLSPLLIKRYLTMKNHHQGMYLATRQLLLDWKDRKKCDFARVRNRPGTRAQPSQGTQRVWMSSQMLYGAQHCNVQQVLPIDTFGTLTVLHVPNKNYRRVGKYRNRTFSDGTEVFEQPHPTLLSAIDLHIGIRYAFQDSTWNVDANRPLFYTKPITMIDDVTVASDRTPLLERRMEEYAQYVERGGFLSPDDMKKVDLVEIE